MKAPEESRFELRPRTHASTSPVTLQTIYEVLIEKKAAVQRIEGMLSEERADKQRMEATLSNERDARISLQQILIQSTIDERESRV